LKIIFYNTTASFSYEQSSSATYSQMTDRFLLGNNDTFFAV